MEELKFVSIDFFYFPCSLEHCPWTGFVVTRMGQTLKTTFDFELIKSLNFDKLQEYFCLIEDKSEFCKYLIHLTSTSPSVSLIKILSSILNLSSNYQLRDELTAYFGLPIFTKLSEVKLNYEIELCQDPRLLEAVRNISKSLDNPLVSLQAGFAKIFLHNILNSSDVCFVEEAIKFVTLLLAQPSCRRFLKPLLEDILFASVIKYKGVNQEILLDFESIFYFPIDEISGVYYESREEYVAAHFSKVRSLQIKLFGHFPGLELLAKASQNSFIAYGNIIQIIGNFDAAQICQILFQIGLDGFSRELSSNVLIDAIASHLLLRAHQNFDSSSIFPTEANLFFKTILRPLSAESLSHEELLQRHQRILQANLFDELSVFVKENIDTCNPVLNRNGKTEFSGWTRDAMEVVSSAIVKTSCPDVQKQGKYQKIELEVTVPLTALDQLSLKSWIDLKATEVVFVCRIDAQESGDFHIKTLRSVIVDSKSISKNILTLRLLVDPDQFEMNARTEIYSKLNFIIKRSSAESNDVRLLRSIVSQMPCPFPEFIEESLLGISHPDEVEFHSKAIESSNSYLSSCLNSGLSIVDGPFGSGVTNLVKETTKSLLAGNRNTTVLFRSGPAADKFYQDLIDSGVPEYQIVRLGFSSTLGHIQQKYANLIKAYVEIINTEILSGFDYNGAIYSCGEADYIMRGIIRPQWEAFQILLEEADQHSRNDLQATYPFSKCAHFDGKNFKNHFDWICSIFTVANKLAPLELLQSSSNISKYVLGNLAKVVLMTSKYAATNSKALSESGLNFESLLVDDCNLIPEIEVILALSSQVKPSNLKRLGLFGHLSGGRPQCFNESLKAAGASITLMDRFIHSGFSKTITLKPRSEESNDSDLFSSSKQFVSVPAILGKGEEMPMRNYIQNLDEAEYSVALFQFLRLRGVPAKDTAILSAYKGQVDLIKEVLQSRCNWTDFYGEPAFIGTMDQSIGLHFKNVIVSLVRTKSPGFLADSSRLQLAFTRSSGNLLVLASAHLFAKQLDLKSLTLKDGASFGNVEEFTKYVYDLGLDTLQ